MNEPLSLATRLAASLCLVANFELYSQAAHLEAALRADQQADVQQDAFRHSLALEQHGPLAAQNYEPQVNLEALFACRKVVSAVEDSLHCSGLQSTWTAQLAEALTVILQEAAPFELTVLLAAHGWQGTQFHSPPVRASPLADLEVFHVMLISRGGPAQLEQPPVHLARDLLVALCARRVPEADVTA